MPWFHFYTEADGGWEAGERYELRTKNKPTHGAVSGGPSMNPS